MDVLCEWLFLEAAVVNTVHCFDMMMLCYDYVWYAIWDAFIKTLPMPCSSDISKSLLVISE